MGLQVPYAIRNLNDFRHLDSGDTTTWTPQVCRIMPFMAVIMGLGLLCGVQIIACKRLHEISTYVVKPKPAKPVPHRHRCLPRIGVPFLDAYR